MRVWIDLANSPHPVLFAPIADALEADGHELVVTTRDHAQTLALTRKRWPAAEVVGARSPDGLIAKAGAVVGRARGLAQFARRTRPDLAVSHNSYAQTMAARVVGVPCVTGMDYEYQPANHVAFRCAQRVIVPTVFPEAALRRQGARPDKVWRYDGFKEEIYLHRLEPDPTVLRSLGLREGEPFVVARPSPRGATYHRQENPLFDRAVRAVLTRTDAKVVLIARREEDLAPYRAAFADRVVRPTGPVDGPSLLYFACGLLGAGGTMNREAALLGTPVVSLYAGALGAADRSLVKQGRVLIAPRDPDRLALLLVGVTSGDRPNSRAVLDSRVFDRFLAGIVEPLGRSRLQSRIRPAAVAAPRPEPTRAASAKPRSLKGKR